MVYNILLNHLKDSDQLQLLLICALREAITFLIVELSLAVYDYILNHNVAIDVSIVLHLHDDVFDLLILMNRFLFDTLLRKNYAQ
jgi:hypothetical protein